MSVETDQVLSAIRRGEDSLPRLRLATGLDYAKLHVELHKLEFEWRSIQRSETADGYDRYAPMPSESTNGGNKGGHGSAAMPVPPAAFVQSKLGLAAREVSLIQRDAPHCVGCRNLCFLNGTGERVQWRCRACNETFDGSLMGRIDPDPEPPKQRTGISVMRPREELGPEEEARIAEEVDRELAAIDDDEQVKQTLGIGEPRCGCGYTANHRGRCADGQKKSARQDNVPTHCEKCGKSLAGQKKINMNRCPSCWSAYLRECNDRRKAKENGHSPKPGEDITETIARNSTANEGSKHAMGETRDIIPDKFQAAGTTWADAIHYAADEFRVLGLRVTRDIDRMRKLLNLMVVARDLDDIQLPDYLSLSAVFSSVTALNHELKKATNGSLR